MISATLATIVVLLLVLLSAALSSWRVEEGFYNASDSWPLAACDLGKDVTLHSVGDVSYDGPAGLANSCPVDPQRQQCGPASAGNALGVLSEGPVAHIGSDTAPRYLDRAFASCDPVHGAMSGFRINTESVGSDRGSLQATALCAAHVQHRQSGNTQTRRTPYVNAWQGAAGLVADCDGDKALVAMGFETDAADDDKLRMRYDCAYDTEIDTASTARYYTGWSGTGDTVDAYDQHTVRCPLPRQVLTRVEYKRCPRTQLVSAVYDCAKTTHDPRIVVGDAFYSADPPTQPSAVLTRDVTGDMQFDRELAKSFSPLAENLVGAGRQIGKIAENTVLGVGRVGRGVGAVFTGVGNGFVGAGNKMATQVKLGGEQFVKQDLGKVERAFTTMPGAVKARVDASVKANLDPALKAVTGVGKGINSSVENFKKRISQTFSGIIEGIPAAFDRFGGQSKTCWKSVGSAWRV